MDEVQRIFKEELPNISVKDGGLKGILDKDLAKQLLELDPGMDKDADSYNEHFEKIKKFMKMNDGELNEELVHNPNKLKLVKKLKTLGAEEMDAVGKAYEQITRSAGYNQIAKQTPKILNNVLVSSVIGCTFLNVIYGKSMKAIENKRASKKNNAQEVK